MKEVTCPIIQPDSIKDKFNLGTNTILALSISAEKATSGRLRVTLHQFLRGVQGNILLVPMITT